jgi:hypothetical protein
MVARDFSPWEAKNLCPLPPARQAGRDGNAVKAPCAKSPRPLSGRVIGEGKNRPHCRRGRESIGVGSETLSVG